MSITKAVAVAIMCGSASPTLAAAPFVCGGFAQLGGAQLLCSHVDPKAPPQICTFSWALTSTAGDLSIQEGSFLLPKGVMNATVYQASGFSGQLGLPIVLCQGRRPG